MMVEKISIIKKNHSDVTKNHSGITVNSTLLMNWNIISF